jgi:GGDEF domain-containing protein
MLKKLSRFDAIMIDLAESPERGECVPKRVNRLEVGDVIGEMGVMTSGARCVSVVAAARGEVLELSQTHLERIRLLYPRTASRFFANLTSVLTEKLIKADKSLSQFCILDDDTGILNRDAFLNCLDQEISRALRFNDPLALCLLDLDDQNNGFDANPLNAERFICEVANGVSGSFRKADTFGRLDKSTIAIICVRATGAFSDAIYGRLKSGINAQSIRDTGVNSTISYRFIDLDCLLSNKIDDAMNDLGNAIDSAKHKTKKKILYDAFHAITNVAPRN